MGATVFNQARVSSRTTATGQIAYLWEENTHCIKDGPKHASWCAMAFGTKADMIRRIYLLASSIPGGMLKVGGRSPTAFVDAMLKLLEAPRLLIDDVVHLENHSKGFYTAIHDYNRGAVRQYLIASGRGDLAKKIQDPGEKPTQVAFSLDTDFEVLRFIMNDLEYEGQDINDLPSRQKGMPKWHAFRGCYAAGEEGPTETSNPSFASPCLDLKLYRSRINLAYTCAPKENPLFVATFNGEVVFMGTTDFDAYCLSDVVIRVAGNVHVQTGRAVLRPLIKALDAARANPMQLPESAVFSFVKGSSSWKAKNYCLLRDQLGKTGDISFRATAAELERLQPLPGNALCYAVHDAKVQIEEQQLELLAEVAQ